MMPLYQILLFGEEPKTIEFKYYGNICLEDDPEFESER